jgi:hypothetical protein
MTAKQRREEEAALAKENKMREIAEASLVHFKLE